MAQKTTKRTKKKKKKKKNAIISLFSGALGLDLGLEAAGFRIAVAVEPNRFAKETIEQNRPQNHKRHVPVLAKRIEDLTTDEILKAAGLKVGEAAVVTGGPSCQAFSTAGQRGSLVDQRGTLFRDFLRVVKEARPRFFIMENVRGVLSAAKKHRPLAERGPGHPALEPDEVLGSALNEILRDLASTGYFVVFGLVNAADYGVPQTRERVIFVGSRDGEPLELPVPTHAQEPKPGRKPWVTLEQALAGLNETNRVCGTLCRSKVQYLSMIPAGGNWRDLPTKLKRKALGAAYVSWGGRVGFFRRLSWSRPSPSLTSRPDSKATMLIHPDEVRPLSVGEYARIQQFPKHWKFKGGTPQQYLQIGNAVPVGLGKAVGLAIKKAMSKRRRLKTNTKKVWCPDAALAQRLAGRPATVLDPPRMRKARSGREEDPAECASWKDSRRTRKSVLKYLATSIESFEVAGR